MHFPKKFFEQTSCFIILGFSLLSLIFSVSVNQNRIQDLQDTTASLQQVNQELSTMSPNPADAAMVPELNRQKLYYQQRIDDTTGTMNYGLGTALEKILKHKLVDPADYFHALSSETNLIVMGICSCMIAYSISKFLTQKAISLNELFFSMLTGMIGILVIRGSKSFLTSSATNSMELTNPYGFSLMTALIGLYSDKFYTLLPSLFDVFLTRLPSNKKPDSG